MADGPWQLYVFATETKGLKDVPYPQWETPPTTRVELSGKYWFKVHFNSDGRDVLMEPGPLSVIKDARIKVTPNGYQQQQR